jgi:hypothetical protein
VITAAEFTERAKRLHSAGFTAAEFSSALARMPPPSPEELALFAEYEARRARRSPWRRLFDWLDE